MVGVQIPIQPFSIFSYNYKHVHELWSMFGQYDYMEGVIRDAIGVISKL